MSDDFIEKFISDCVNDGKSSPKDICSEALKQISKVELEIAESNKLFIQKRNLIAVLKNFDHESVRRGRKSSSIFVNDDLSNIDKDPSYKEFLLKICDLVEHKIVNLSCSSVTKREIMDLMGGPEKNQIVYIAIKWLCDKGILITNEDRSLNVGPNWINRPKGSE